MEKRFLRDPENRVFAGVCSGLANYLNVDANIVRFITIILFFISGGGILLAYIAVAIFIPTAGSIPSKTSGSTRIYNERMKTKQRNEYSLDPNDFTIDEDEYTFKE
jgi:phage shock protein PspC (stress-responsive transcriptional regulator)